jgi:hypothetical protein
MDAFFKFITDNLGWIIVLLFVFGGAILEVFSDWIGALVKSLSGRGKNRQLKASIKAKDAELARAHDLLTAMGPGRAIVMPPPDPRIETAARMARLLDKVQEADTALPQLNSELRAQIDAELEQFHVQPDPLVMPDWSARKHRRR